MREKGRKIPYGPTAYDLVGRSAATEVMKSSAYVAVSSKIIKSLGIQDALDNLVTVKPVDIPWVRKTYMKPYCIDFTSSLITPLGLDPFGLKTANTGIVALLRRSVLEAAGVDRAFQGLVPTVRIDIDDVLPNPFRNMVRRLSPQLPGLAEELAEILYTPNLQGFSESEWQSSSSTW